MTATTYMPTPTLHPDLEPRRSERGVRRNRIGFWVVALAFTTVMAFTTLPTPLWSLYAQQDHFSSFTVTIAFGVYALAVALSLFLAGHLSDWHGRRKVLLPAIALQILAAVVFAVWPVLPGLLVGRILSGLGVGAVTATATAWLADLEIIGARRAQLVAIGANLGGLGLGGLISGPWRSGPQALYSYLSLSSPSCWQWPGWASWRRPRRTVRSPRGRATGRSVYRFRRAPADASSPPLSAP
jgi:MFS family permease